MALFESPIDHPPSKLRRYLIRIAGVIVTIAVFMAVFPAYLWYPFVYHREVATAHRLMDAVSKGDLQQAYQIWKPSASYSFKDFNGRLGPGRILRAGEKLPDRAAGTREERFGDRY